MNDKAPSSLNWIYPLALVLALAIVGGGGYLAYKQHSFDILALGGVALIAVLVTWPIAATSHCARDESAKAIVNAVAPLNERLEEFSVMLTLMSEQQLLTDRAKSVAFREKERDTLRRAIQEEIGRGDYEAAMALANEIESSFGLKQEADRFRQDITQRRADVVRKQINDAMAGIDRLCRAEQWQQATREAERLAQLFPTDEVARGCGGEVERRREAYKQQLIQAFHDARSRNDIDGSIEIVKQLDMYLTPTEAETYQEAVRGVFKDKLNNLRAQFSLAVHDQHWAEAVRVGESIIRDFPNTQMAKEVRDKMDALRQRAAAPEEVGA